MVYHFNNHHFELEDHYIERFHRDGFVKLKNFLNPDAISFLRKRGDSEMTSGHF